MLVSTSFQVKSSKEQSLQTSIAFTGATSSSNDTFASCFSTTSSNFEFYIFYQLVYAHAGTSAVKLGILGSNSEER